MFKSNTFFIHEFCFCFCGSLESISSKNETQLQTSRAICKAMSVLKFKFASRKCDSIQPGNFDRLS